MWETSRYGFRDRDKLIQTVKQAQPGELYDIYGEAGIGKSRLLQEACEQLRPKELGIHIIHVDLSRPDILAGSGHYLQLMKIIAQEMPEITQDLEGIETDQAAELAGEITRKAIQLAEKEGYLLLILDTTEVLQEDSSFWRWLEENLIGPLLLESQARIIFSGRIPAPLNRWEVRRSIKLIPVMPLPYEKYAMELAGEVLECNMHTAWDAAQKADFVQLVLDFSFGHPELTIILAEKIAQIKPTRIDAELRKRICVEFIAPFIEENFFTGIEEKWKRILWWASILNWFDSSILQLYLKHVEPALGEETEWFYINGIKELRIHKTVVWHESKGDRLHGVIRDIVRQCLRYIDEQKYNQARQAARATFHEIAGAFTEEGGEAQIYANESALFA